MDNGEWRLSCMEDYKHIQLIAPTKEEVISNYRKQRDGK